MTRGYETSVGDTVKENFLCLLYDFMIHFFDGLQENSSNPRVGDTLIQN
jgi:hypothetical protein